MLTILYQDSGTLVVQSHAGEFDKLIPMPMPWRSLADLVLGLLIMA